MYIRNAIVKNARISFESGAARLENVYFVNCTFDIKSALNTRPLAIALLAKAPSTTFPGE
jgi:hypothetical protein